MDLDRAQRGRATVRLVEDMERGLPWEAGLSIGRATAYRWRRRAESRGAERLRDGRHGHAYKMCGPVRTWMEDYCRGAPCSAGRDIQSALRHRFGLTVSVSQINRVRATLGLSRRRGGGGKCGGCLAACAGLAGRGGMPTAPRRRPRDRPAPRVASGRPARR